MQDPSVRPCLEELDAIVAYVHTQCEARDKDKLKNSEQLLHQMLPPHVAEALRNGRKVMMRCCSIRLVPDLPGGRPAWLSWQ